METINFLKLIGKIFNFKGAGADIKFNDPLAPAVRSICDHR